MMAELLDGDSIGEVHDQVLPPSSKCSSIAMATGLTSTKS